MAVSGNWVQVEILVDRFIQSKGQHAMSKFAKSLSLKDLVTDKSLINRESVRIQLINLFVKHGTTIDPSVSVSTLEAAVRNLEWQVCIGASTQVQCARNSVHSHFMYLCLRHSFI